MGTRKLLNVAQLERARGTAAVPRRSARNANLLALALALMCTASPAVARADGGLDGLASLLAWVLVQGIAVIVGIAAVLAALLSRSRPVWLFALLASAANGVLALVGLLKTAGQPVPYSLLGFASPQLALGVIACPCLILWRRTEPTSPTEARSTHLSLRWLLLWILGHTAVGMLATGVTWPLIMALASDDPATRAESILRLMPVSALLSGLLIGLMEWLLLRITLRVGALWIACTALGAAAGMYVAGPLRSQFFVSALVGGAVAGAAQWPLLRRRLMNAWLWVLASAVSNLANWPAALLLGAVPSVAAVLGPLLAALKALVTGVALQHLARRVAP